MHSSGMCTARLLTISQHGRGGGGMYPSMHWAGGVSQQTLGRGVCPRGCLPRGCLPGGVCPGGVCLVGLPRGVSAWGMSVQGVSAQGVSARGVSAQGGCLLGGSASGVWQTPSPQDQRQTPPPWTDRRL